MAGNGEVRTGASLRKLLGEQLVEAGVIDEAMLRTALVHQRKAGGRLGACLVDLRLATEQQIVTALASKLSCAVVDVSSLARDAALEAALGLLPADVALRNRCLPVAADKGSLTVAMADPTNFAVVDELAFRVGRRVQVGIAGEREIEDAVRRLYSLEKLERKEPAPAPAGSGPPPLPAGLRARTDEDHALWHSEEIVAALARLLVRRGLVTEIELVAELERGF